MYDSKLHWTLSYLSFCSLLSFAVYISISAFVSLVDISKGIMSSTLGLNIFAIITRIKNYKSAIKKNKQKHDEIALLAKTNLDCIKGSISMSLTDTYIGCNYFLLIDVLREYDSMEENISKFET